MKRQGFDHYLYTLAFRNLFADAISSELVCSAESSLPRTMIARLCSTFAMIGTKVENEARIMGSQVNLKQRVIERSQVGYAQREASKRESPAENLLQTLNATHLTLHLLERFRSRGESLHPVIKI